ncbi:MAG: tadA [Candidatus Midichloriaceae bacterium]|jgi:tRNA(Arg) A34 adenosine deaminase TadA|nr:tadA [Candidatus Midichloriaceae bacterium]
MNSQDNFMKEAFNMAISASILGEVPVGAVIVKGNKVLASSHNLCISSCDPTAHAEMLVIRRAAQLTSEYRLTDCDLYVTLEPCPMCAQAISFARIRRLYFGASDIKGGAVENGARIYNHPSCFHVPEVFGGIMEEECSGLLKTFFQSKRL